jgi:hypothetical protein
VEKIFYIDRPWQTDLTNIIYLCKPQLALMRLIADQVKSNGNNPNGPKRSFQLFLVPRRTLVCEHILEELGVFGDLNPGEMPLDLVAFEDDLLSLELTSTFKDVDLGGDSSPLMYAARALMRLQSMYGYFPRILGKGNQAFHLADILLRLRNEAIASASSGEAEYELALSPNIDALVIFDRSCDLVTPLLTQLTFEGLIDEMVGIKSAYTEVDLAAPTPTDDQGPSVRSRKKRIQLSSMDPVFPKIRDLNFSVVEHEIGRLARLNRELEESRHAAKSVAQLKQFAGRIQNIQTEKASLVTLDRLREVVNRQCMDEDFSQFLDAQEALLSGVGANAHNDLAEELINKGKPLVLVLRLLCLQCLVNGGLRQKQYDYFSKEIVQTYGYHHTITLQNLEKVGLLYPQTSSKNTFSSVRKNLQLVVDDFGTPDAPSDISYTYKGYAPLLVRLLQQLVKPSTNNSDIVGWKPLEDAMASIPGAVVDVTQKSEGTKHAQDNKVTLVMFLGGCTYAEVSAVRFLSHLEKDRREFIVLTTEMINGNTLIDPLCAHIPSV